MATSINAFDYHLPEDRIAQKSVEPRDQAKMMVLHKQSQSIEHRKVVDILSYLQEGDVLVRNVTKVFKARLHGRKPNGTIDLEVTLLRERDGWWEAMIYPGRRVQVGQEIRLGGHTATVQKKTDRGVTFLSFDCSDEEVFDLCEQEGEIPVPPYVHQAPETLDAYQTVYARERGSVAAPTAGMHFTPELLEEMKKMGVQIEEVVLHIGIGTFQPVKTDTIEAHKMHEEHVSIDAETAARIRLAKTEGRRVIAIGTTTVRALEGSGVPEGGFTGDVNLFIQPGFNFQVVDGLFTNFHLPKTTLLVLVSAFAGREYVLRAYQEAVEQDYRFFSFGDAMCILP